MDLNLNEKVVVVMASSEGIGKATALQFAKKGANVFLSSRNETALKEAVSEIKALSENNNVYYRVCDVTDGDAIKQFIKYVIQASGNIDVLVNNAGGPPAGTFDHFSDEDWQHAFELNLLSFIRTIREVLPSMRENGSGKIVNIASSSIKETIDNLILSNTFRAGVVGLAKSLSRELAADNILINTIGPGRIETNRMKSLSESRAEKQGVPYEQLRQQSESEVPMGRYGLPKEFANLVVFLCSGANTYVTGQSLTVDGGLVRAL